MKSHGEESKISMVFWRRGFPGSSTSKEATRRPWFNSWVRKIRWRKDRLPTPVFLGFPGDSAGKESACNAGDLGLIPGLRRSGEGKGYPLQYSDLENEFAESDMIEQFSLFWEKRNISMKTVPHLLRVAIAYICR